jgi:hypothetical protein
MSLESDTCISRYTDSEKVTTKRTAVGDDRVVESTTTSRVVLVPPWDVEAVNNRAVREPWFVLPGEVVGGECRAVVVALTVAVSVGPAGLAVTLCLSPSPGSGSLLGITAVAGARGADRSD